MKNNIELKEQLKLLERKLYVIYGIGLLVLVSLAILSNFILKRQAAEQATSLIKRTVARGDYRETIYTLNDAKLDYFEAVVYYKEDETRLFSLPAQLDPGFVSDDAFVTKLLHSRLKIDLFFDEQGQHKIGSVLFIFGRLSHVPYAVLIWLFFLLGTLPIIRTSRHKVVENHQKLMAFRDESARADLARRVRHDIRSPLGALQIAIQNLTGLQTKHQIIIHRATERIGEIVSELEMIRAVDNKTAVAPVEGESSSPQSVLTLVQTIIQEKRAQRPTDSKTSLILKVSEDAFLLFAKINASDFKRALSNLIDNSIEALSEAGKITVNLESKNNKIRVSVTDDGCGISLENLPRVTEKGFTSKTTGSGLGLYYAKETTEKAGGTLTVSSMAHVGTTVTIEIPQCKPPSWYVPAIEIPKNGTVVILDDQESSHLSWKLKLDSFKEQGESFTVMQFKSAFEFIRWHETLSPTERVLYLFDYDLGPRQPTGLDLARELKIEKNALLVTGHFDSEDIQRRCIDAHLGLVSKSYLSQISLKSV